LRSALSGMTAGMAVALSVTVTGIASALVLKFEYFMLDNDIAELFDMITEISEIYVMSALERRPNARP
jgi:biopolymer transport protein ExbB/TolQ